MSVQTTNVRTVLAVVMASLTIPASVPQDSQVPSASCKSSQHAPLTPASMVGGALRMARGRTAAPVWLDLQVHRVSRIRMTV